MNSGTMKLSENVVEGNYDAGFARKVGQNLRNARENCGLGFRGKSITQKDAGDQVGVTAAQISHYESGRRVPPLKIFADLCALYKVECSDMLGIPRVVGGTTAHQKAEKKAMKAGNNSSKNVPGLAIGHC